MNVALAFFTGLEAAPAPAAAPSEPLDDISQLPGIVDRRDWYRVQRDTRLARGIDALEDVVVRMLRGRALKAHLLRLWREHSDAAAAGKRRRDRARGRPFSVS